MTDLFEGIAASSSREFLEIIKRPDFNMNRHVNYFQKKMKDLGLEPDTVFILLGEEVRKRFSNFINGTYKTIQITKYAVIFDGFLVKSDIFTTLKASNILFVAHLQRAEALDDLYPAMLGGL